MHPDGAFKTHTSLVHNLYQAYLDILILEQRNKTARGSANPAPPKHSDTPFFVPQSSTAAMQKARFSTNRKPVLFVTFNKKSTNKIRE